MQAITTASMTEHIGAWTAYLLEERGLQASTVGCYRAVVEEFGVFVARAHADEPVPLEGVRKDTVSSFLRERRRNGGVCSPATWNGRLAALRSFFGYLKKQELLRDNPADLLDRQRKKRRTKPAPLTFDEMLRLLSAAEGSSPAYRARNVAIVHVLFHTGVRVAELVSLDVAQVDFDGRRFLDVRTKGDHIHEVLFNDVVAAGLDAYLKVRDEFGLHEEEPALFLSDRGRRLSIRSVQDLVGVLAERAGISRNVHPHLFRRSNATELSALGVELPVIQDHLGHADVNTTRGYIDTSEEQRRDAVDALGKHFTKRYARRSTRPAASV